jgi:3-oxoacyl-ACP reductase-like protein
MSIFGKIMEKIFPASHAQAVAPASAAPHLSAAPASAPAHVAPAEPVDVDAVLTEMAKKNPQELHWRNSIVDLMKLLNLDSSLSARQELARELNYPGDQKDSASMNIWLHREVMKKLAANGGRVPADLRVSA